MCKLPIWAYLAFVQHFRNRTNLFCNLNFTWNNREITSYCKKIICKGTSEVKSWISLPLTPGWQVRVDHRKKKIFILLNIYYWVFKASLNSNPLHFLSFFKISYWYVGVPPAIHGLRLRWKKTNACLSHITYLTAHIMQWIGMTQ